jgi:hypothetical protein
VGKLEKISVFKYIIFGQGAPKYKAGEVCNFFSPSFAAKMNFQSSF